MKLVCEVGRGADRTLECLAATLTDGRPVVAYECGAGDWAIRFSTLEVIRDRPFEEIFSRFITIIESNGTQGITS